MVLVVHSDLPFWFEAASCENVDLVVGGTVGREIIIGNNNNNNTPSLEQM